MLSCSSLLSAEPESRLLRPSTGPPDRCCSSIYTPSEGIRAADQSRLQGLAPTPTPRTDDVHPPRPIAPSQGACTRYPALLVSVLGVRAGRWGLVRQATSTGTRGARRCGEFRG